ncbi:MAG TPA: NAD(P)-dependent oxidoreductase, partial [Myxococcota bacterium]|nr:NAD(P)-dependent oxidoreductase [Myxococcota bacterium]
MASLYGSGDDPEKFLPALVRALREERPFRMTAGAQLREWLHIDDALRAMFLALDSPAPPEVCAVNIGTGDGITLRDLALRVCQLMGASPSLLQIGALPYRGHEVHHLVMNVERQARLLGFVPQWDLEAGLSRFLGHDAAPQASHDGEPRLPEYPLPRAPAARLGARSA